MKEDGQAWVVYKKTAENKSEIIDEFNNPFSASNAAVETLAHKDCRTVQVQEVTRKTVFFHTGPAAD